VTAAIILPPREMFSAGGSGAVGLLARHLAQGGDALVYGMPTASPFTDVLFQPVVPRLRPASLAIRYAAGLLAAMRLAKPSTIEVHNRPDIALYLAARLPGVPVLLFLHNDPQGMRGAKAPAERCALLAKMARIATVSAYLRSRLIDGVPDAPDVAIFPNFVDLAAMPKPTPEQIILFAGRVVADKGADSFVAACALALPQLPGWRAEMIGADRFGADSPETPFLRTLRPQAERAGVSMRGWKPHAEVLAAMARAAIVVVPSRWPEPFGLAALEAMACGAALLCSPRGGLVEVMGAAAMPIDPDDPPGIAAVIVQLARDPFARAALSQAGLARAASFSAETARARLADLRTEAVRRWPNRTAHPI
jgi:glycosyltransferase involved in cell wall biosynthesis